MLHRRQKQLQQQATYLQNLQKQGGIMSKKGTLPARRYKKKVSANLRSRELYNLIIAKYQKEHPGAALSLKEVANAMPLYNGQPVISAGDLSRFYARDSAMSEPKATVIAEYLNIEIAHIDVCKVWTNPTRTQKQPPKSDTHLFTVWPLFNSTQEVFK